MALAKLNEAQSAFLNVLRASGAMMVMMSHAVSVYLKDSDEARLGTIGVFVFFLLSGFLINYSVAYKVGDERYLFRDYFSDRFCRIFCAFAPALFFVAIVDAFSLRLLAGYAPEAISNMYTGIQTIGSRYSITSWFGNLLMLQMSPIVKAIEVLRLSNGPLVEPFGSAGPFWTISIEWWIYMIFGYFAFFYSKSIRLNIFQRSFFVFSSLTPFYFLIGGTDECLTCIWIVGMVVSLLIMRFPDYVSKFKQGWSERDRRRICLTAFVFFVVAVLGRLAAIKNRTGSFNNLAELQVCVFLAGAIFSLLLYLGRFGQIPRWFSRAAAFSADYSYSLYLTHSTVIIFFYLAFPGHDNDYGQMAKSILVANLVAIAFWWLFERHYRTAARWMKVRLRDRRFAPVSVSP